LTQAVRKGGEVWRYKYDTVIVTKERKLTDTLVLRQVDSRQAERLLQTPRTGLPSSKTLKGFLEGEQLASIEILAAIADQPLIQRLEPGALVGLDRLCNLRQWRQGDPVERPAGGVLILLAGSCEQRQSLVPGSAPKTIAEHGSGTIVGLADYFGEPKSGSQARLVASPDGCSALVFSRTGFGNLLDVSPIFEQSLIRELAISCESLQRSLQAARQQQQHQRMRRIDSEQLG
jgi:CRP-like cAMP-binding protein